MNYYEYNRQGTGESNLDRAKEIYRRFFELLKTSEEAFIAAYLDTYEMIKSFSIEELLDILEHKNNPKIVTMNVDWYKMPQFIRDEFKSIETAIINHLCNEAKQELAERIRLNKPSVFNKSPYFGIENAFKKICEFDKIDDDCRYVAFNANICHVSDGFEKLMSKYALALIAQEKKVNEGKTYTSIRPSLSNQIFSDTIKMLPSHKESLISEYPKKKVIESTKSSIERDFLINFILATSYSTDVYSQRNDRHNTTFIDYDERTEVFKEQLSQKTDDDLKALAKIHWNSRCFENIKNQLEEHFSWKAEGTEESGALMYVDIRGRFHDKRYSATCPICGGLMHVVYAYGDWQWWHDDRLEFSTIGHQRFDPILTETEIKKYQLQVNNQLDRIKYNPAVPLNNPVRLYRKADCYDAQTERKRLAMSLQASAFQYGRFNENENYECEEDRTEAELNHKDYIKALRDTYFDAKDNNDEYVMDIIRNICFSYDIDIGFYIGIPKEIVDERSSAKLNAEDIQILRELNEEEMKEILSNCEKFVPVEDLINETANLLNKDNDQGQIEDFEFTELLELDE